MMSKHATSGALLESGSSAVPMANPLIVALSAWDLISIRTYGCLVTATRWFEPGEGPGGIAIEALRLGDVAVVSARDMLRVPNFGRRCYFDLYAAMKMFGWSWGHALERETEQDRRRMEAALAARAHLATQRREALERAGALRDLHDREGLTRKDIARRVGLSESVVQRKIAEIRKVEEMRSRYPLMHGERTLN
ncbi:hypothetical protein [Rhizorhapis sp. SPR117]|nr:hypothetical protein K426_11610 [Sphingobium sp. TKS]MCF8709066.1 hypothetical protein [Rhizorhapis sp. SPR117]